MSLAVWASRQHKYRETNTSMDSCIINIVSAFWDKFGMQVNLANWRFGFNHHLLPVPDLPVATLSGKPQEIRSWASGWHNTQVFKPNQQCLPPSIGNDCGDNSNPELQRYITCAVPSPTHVTHRNSHKTPFGTHMKPGVGYALKCNAIFSYEQGQWTWEA